MKGFVPTPLELVDQMVAKLFRDRRPAREDRLLDPGCGTGVFIQGVLHWCHKNRAEVPHIVGVELEPSRFGEAKRVLGGTPKIEVRQGDFLKTSPDRYDYIIGNPPYVSIQGLSIEERTHYRQQYAAAQGRFDLYLLFFEQSLRLLKPEGRLVFVTPEKFLYVQTASALRRQLAALTVEEIDLIDESAFGGLVTYPTVTTVVGRPSTGETLVRLRDGTEKTISVPNDGSSWLPHMRGNGKRSNGPTLSDVFVRISCGVATGADNVFVVDESTVDPSLREFAYPTISGRQLEVNSPVATKESMLIPYTNEGVLLAESELGALGNYLRDPGRRKQLLRRTCVSRKPWFAFHETPPLNQILRPKILCKDIGQRPWFVVDESGEIVPRHSVYYLVPEDASQIHELCDYLNSAEAHDWLMEHCQRAANGFVRLQSHVLKMLPVPDRFLLQGQLASA